jgi:hypothetical protein
MAPKMEVPKEPLLKELPISHASITWFFPTYVASSTLSSIFIVSHNYHQYNTHIVSAFHDLVYIVDLNRL